ncbi:MAG TPA: hypothetical protein VHC49_13235, partial [Mycobacteriales bacterium]|nr:hypothetical protein [Mycobacteriales bacterium]
MSAERPAPRAVLRAVLTHPEGLPWLFRALPSLPVSALAAASCGLLVSWHFARPTDGRIVPFVQDLTRREGASQSVAPESVDAMVRGLLGDEQLLHTIPPAQFTVIQVMISRAMVFGEGLGPAQVDQLLDRAEAEVGRLDLSLGVQPAPRTPPAPGPVHRPALWSGLAVAIAVVAVLVTGLAVPGWMLGDSTDTTSAASVMHKLIDARNAEDMDTVAALSCRHWSPAELQQLKQQIKAAPPTHGTPVGTLHVKGNTATQQIRITEPTGKPELATVRLARRGGSWCVVDTDAPAAPSSPSSAQTPSSSSAPPPSSTAPSSAEPTIPPPAVYDALAARFLSQVNAAHTATAESLLCRHSSSDARAHIEAVI